MQLSFLVSWQEAKIEADDKYLHNTDADPDEEIEPNFQDEQEEDDPNDDGDVDISALGNMAATTN